MEFAVFVFVEYTLIFLYCTLQPLRVPHYEKMVGSLNYINNHRNIRRFMDDRLVDMYVVNNQFCREFMLYCLIFVTLNSMLTSRTVHADCAQIHTSGSRHCHST